MHCNRYMTRPLNRRDMLLRCGNGFGALALAALMNDPAYGATLVGPAPTSVDPMALRPPHFPAQATSVIFLYMDGGPSHLDTFDPKPRLDREHGQPIKVKTHPTQFNNVGNVLKSPWKFHRYGQSGIPVSDLFPQVAESIDDICVIRSMVSNFSEHTSANYFLHTGSGIQGKPSHGAWVTYGLGSECRELPGFVVLNGGLIPPGGLDCFNSGFLPASFQGSVFRRGERRWRTSILSRGRPQHSAASSASCTSSIKACWVAWAITTGRVVDRQLRAGLPHADCGAQIDRH